MTFCPECGCEDTTSGSTVDGEEIFYCSDCEILFSILERPKNEHWLNPDQILDKYGSEMWEKMKNCPYLAGITCKINPDGSHSIPHVDLDLAYRWANEQPIRDEEVD